MSLTEAKDKTGEGVADEIIEALNKHKMNLNELCFESYDYTASMSGQFNGVQKKIQDKLGRRIPYMPCLAHRSNTVIEHSCEPSAVIKELFNVLEELYVFFTSSTKRVWCLQESIIGAAVDNPLQLRNLSKTRWVVRAESIKAVWSTYEAILESLAILQERSKDIKTKTAASEIQAAVIFAEHLGVDAQTVFQRHHRHRKPPARIDENPSNAVSLNLESFYRKEFKAVLNTQISTYKEVNNNSKETTRPLIDTLHPGKDVAPLESFKDLTEYFPRDQRPDPEALMSEMEVFRSHLTDDYHTNIQDISDAARIAEKQKSVFPLVNKAYRLALTAPVTVAKDERTFSKLKLVQNTLQINNE
ncbi:zinc finger MYM-type 1-like [Paramuricea clavata]|uniref:Zinc finger MYM-type 1-like n=1 Tax=Paramuricea clavata TaxID=317549 RepID=A0A6S7H5Y5_PARCT|nr:zinc finger MYM-type 1-like [Paramuricea clavata]